jgi:hypothetical protein
MRRYLVALGIGLAIGYTYGYLDGDAGEDSLIDAGLNGIGVHHAMASVRGVADRASQEEKRRQAAIDSIKQARLDSITSAIHH